MVSYFDIVRKTFMDMVPKTIMAFLVNKAKGAQHAQRAGDPCPAIITASDHLLCVLHHRAAAMPRPTEEIQNELVAQLYKENLLADLLRESGDIAQRRQNCSEMRTLLQRALQIVTEVRDYNAFK
jgi:dynamin 1-like protein